MQEIFTVKTNGINDKTFNMLISLLPDNEKQHVLKFKNKKSAANSLVAALLVRYALHKVFNLQFNEIEIVRKSNSKPYLKGISDIHFSISHSNNLVVCIVSDTHSGIDVQKIKPVSHAIINKVCSEAEIKSISTDSDFIKLWTRKEAVLKKKGTGILDSTIKNCTESETVHSIKYEDYWISYTL